MEFSDVKDFVDFERVPVPRQIAQEGRRPGPGTARHRDGSERRRARGSFDAVANRTVARGPKACLWSRLKANPRRPVNEARSAPRPGANQGNHLQKGIKSLIKNGKDTLSLRYQRGHPAQILSPSEDARFFPFPPRDTGTNLKAPVRIKAD
ncbi:hypothetical protein [Rhodovulum sulfidophilum]|uniref:hypothetical protein n=1 Tax=Rhodovulum sulfidophilum TaxID=35806 RepID=UPI001A376F7B|nr:hypothetical protein [Rhodovulum sulfidophilum]MBL3553152.1 hypothetical protein [Rhodovulum sulfidophilum]